MTPAERIVTITPDVRATTAMALMGERGIRHLLVTRASGGGLAASDVLGVLTISDLTAHVAGDQSNALSTLISAAESSTSAGAKLADEINKPELAGSPEADEINPPLIGFIAAAAAVAALTVTHNAWMAAHATTAMIAVFTLGYVGIIFEEVFELNKAAVAILMSVALWVLYADFGGPVGALSATPDVLEQLAGKLSEVRESARPRSRLVRPLPRPS